MAEYFVSYNWQKGSSYGAGCTSVSVENGVRNFNDVMLITEALENSNPDVGNVTILNWQRFEGQEENDG